jgi:hypothetical protein
MTEFFKEELEAFDKYPERRTRITSHYFSEIKRTYKEEETAIVKEISELSFLNILYLVKGFALRHLRDKNSETIYKAISLWTRPSPDEMPFPSGTELCQTTDDVERYIWMSYR